jgi:ABC-type sugar transport system ATPase subunit
MDANCICRFNEYFEEEIVNEKGLECSYFNFSGAERKNIDLAILFTFMDMRRLQGDIAYNLVMFDELLDSSLDEKGVELVLNIIKERVENHKESIYIISHRKESIKSATGEVVVLEKKNSITTRVDLSSNLI